MIRPLSKGTRESSDKREGIRGPRSFLCVCVCVARGSKLTFGGTCIDIYFIVTKIVPSPPVRYAHTHTHTQTLFLSVSLSVSLSYTHTCRQESVPDLK